MALRVSRARAPVWWAAFPRQGGWQCVARHDPLPLFDADPPVILAALLPSLVIADEAAWNTLREGGIVLFRHAIAPGGGNPPGMLLGDCTTQRNRDTISRDQARRIGVAMRVAGVAVGAMLAFK